MLNRTVQKSSKTDVAQRETLKVPEHTERTFVAAVKAMMESDGPGQRVHGEDAKKKRPRNKIAKGNEEVFRKINEAEELNNLLTIRKIVEESKKRGVTLWLAGGMNVRTLTEKGRHTHDLDFLTVIRTGEDVLNIRLMMADLGYVEERDWGFGLRFKKRIEKTDTQASLIHRVDFLMNLVADLASRMIYVFSEKLIDGGKRSVGPIFDANRKPELVVEVPCASIYDQVIMKAMTGRKRDLCDCLAILADAKDFDVSEFGKRVSYAHEMLESLRKTAEMVHGVVYNYSFGECLLAKLNFARKLLHERGYDYGYPKKEQESLQEKLTMLEQAVGEHTRREASRGLRANADEVTAL